MSRRERADRERTLRLINHVVAAHAARCPHDLAAEMTPFEEVVLNGLDLGDTQPALAAARTHLPPPLTPERTD